MDGVHGIWRLTLGIGKASGGLFFEIPILLKRLVLNYRDYVTPRLSNL